LGFYITQLYQDKSLDFLLPVTHKGRFGKPAVVVPASLVSGRTNQNSLLKYPIVHFSVLPGFGVGGGGIYRSAVDVVAS
jgi:hypothetical protein